MFFLMNTVTFSDDRNVVACLSIGAGFMRTAFFILGLFLAVHGQMIKDEKPLLLEFSLDGGQVNLVIRELIVFEDNNMLLIKDSVFSKDTLYGTVKDTLHGIISDQKRDEVLALFAEESWIMTDTNMIGCMACPVFQIIHAGKSVTGTSPPSEDLKNLFDFLVELMDSFQPTSAKNDFRHRSEKRTSASVKTLSILTHTHSPGLLVNGENYAAPFRIDGRQMKARVNAGSRE